MSLPSLFFLSVTARIRRAMRPALPALLAGATCIALSPIFVRLSDVGPTASAFWRVALAAPLLWVFWAFAPKRGSKKLLLAAALAFTGDLAFWHWSIQYTSVANSTLLANLSSIFVTLAVWILWREKPTGLFLLGLVAALAGVAMLVRTSLDFSPTALLGDAFGVITALFYAWYILSVKGLRDRGATTLHLMTVTSTLTAVFLLPLAVASGDVFFPQGLRGWLTLVGLAWVSQIAGQGLIAYSLAHLPAAFSSVGLLLQPVIAGLIAWALLGEPLVALQIAGGLMVLLGIWLARHGSTN
jgi:drug/metabolite transporter (DMT)-like permease